MERPVRFVVFALLILTAAGRAAAQSHDKEAAQAKPGVPHEAPAPAATARAVAKALTDARARRKESRSALHQRPALPAERRWLVVWPEQPRRVTLTWPEERVALSWPSSDLR